MSGEMNGHSVEPNEDPQKMMADAQAQVDAIVEPIIGNTLNGLLVSLNGVPPEVICRAAARMTGRALSRMLAQGMLPQVLSARAAMKQGFTESMDAVPVAPPNGAGLQMVRK